VHDSIAMDLFQFTGAPSVRSLFYHCDSSKAFELATGATSVEFDTSIPGYKPGVAHRLHARIPSRIRAALLRALERRWRMPRRLAVGAAATGLVALVAIRLVARPEPAALCAPADVELAAVWSPAIRDDLVRRLAGVRGGERTVAFFDRWSREWTALHDEACRPPQGPERKLTEACLIAIRDEVAFSIDLRTQIPPNLAALRDPRHRASDLR
jgi:hypothetical protein